jgi:hypothetical protein
MFCFENEFSIRLKLSDLMRALRCRRGTSWWFATYMYNLNGNAYEPRKTLLYAAACRRRNMGGDGLL